MKDKFLKILILILLLVIILKIYDEVVKLRRKIALDDVIPVGDLDKKIVKMWIVRRSLAGGRWPIATKHFSHWGILCETVDGKYYVVQIQMHNITELKSAKVYEDLVVTYGEKCPWLICEQVADWSLVGSKRPSLKDLLSFTSENYRDLEFSFFGYNCHQATIDIIWRFTSQEYPDNFDRSSKMSVISGVVEEFTQLLD